MVETAYLTIQNVRAAVHSETPKILELLRFDFGEYVSDAETINVDIEVFTVNSPPLFTAGDEIGRFSSGVKYRVDEARTLLEYDNHVCCLWNEQKELAVFWGSETVETDYLYEKIYLFLSSRIGEKLEQRNFSRVHGFAVSMEDSFAIIGLAPSGGGKSTLTEHLLRSGKTKLLSDDTPLLTCAASIVMAHPLYTRLGFRCNADSFVAQQPLDDNERVFFRTDRHDKMLTKPTSKMISWQTASVPVRHIVGLQFTKHPTPRIERLPKWKLFSLLFRDLVIGYGLPQVVEFFLTNGLRSVVEKTPLIARRLHIAIRLTLSTSGWILYQCPDREKNSTLFLQKFGR